MYESCPFQTHQTTVIYEHFCLARKKKSAQDKGCYSELCANLIYSNTSLQVDPNHARKVLMQQSHNQCQWGGHCLWSEWAYEIKLQKVFFFFLWHSEEVIHHLVQLHYGQKYNLLIIEFRCLQSYCHRCTKPNTLSMQSGFTNICKQSLILQSSSILHEQL